MPSLKISLLPFSNPFTIPSKAASTTLCTTNDQPISPNEVISHEKLKNLFLETFSHIKYLYSKISHTEENSIFRETYDIFCFFIYASDEECRSIVDSLNITENNDSKGFGNIFSTQKNKHFKEFTIEQKAAVFRLLILDEIYNKLSEIKNDLYDLYTTANPLQKTAIYEPAEDVELLKTKIGHFFQEIWSILSIISLRIYSALFRKDKNNAAENQPAQSIELTQSGPTENPIKVPKKTSSTTFLKEEVVQIYSAMTEIKLCQSLSEPSDKNRIDEIEKHYSFPNHISMIQSFIKKYTDGLNFSSSQLKNNLYDLLNIDNQLNPLKEKTKIYKEFRELIEKDKKTISGKITEFLTSIFKKHPEIKFEEFLKNQPKIKFEESFKNQSKTKLKDILKEQSKIKLRNSLKEIIAHEEFALFSIGQPFSYLLEQLSTVFGSSVFNYFDLETMLGCLRFNFPFTDEVDFSNEMVDLQEKEAAHKSESALALNSRSLKIPPSQSLV